MTRMAQMTTQSQLTGLNQPEEEPPESSFLPPEESGTRSQRRAQRTRIRLLQAACELFRGQGFERTSIEQITEKADVGKGTFYRHFTTKDELLITVLVEVIEKLDHQLLGKKKPPEDLREALDRLLESHVRELHYRRDSYLLFADWIWRSLHTQEKDPQVESRLQSYLSAVREYLRTVLPADTESERANSLVSGMVALVPLALSSHCKELEHNSWQSGRTGLRQAFLAACQAWLAFRPRAVKAAAEEITLPKEEESK